MMTDFSKVFPSAPLEHPLVLCILDGWGTGNAEDASNAIERGKTPHWHQFLKIGFESRLNASETAVGLPEGQMGNSEVGHLTLGAGRTIFQSLPKINKAIQEKKFEENPVLEKLISTLHRTQRACHLMGLFSPGGVHSHMDHLKALIEILVNRGIPLYLHLFLDGRDTPPTSAQGYYEVFFEKLFQRLPSEASVHIATLAGRFYAMDRDNRWDRVEKAFKAISYGEGLKASSVLDVFTRSYAEKITDEFIFPTVIGDYAGIQEGDGLLCFNFRADRVCELLDALLNPDFHSFERPHPLEISMSVGMTEYSDHLSAWIHPLFSTEKVTESFGEVIAKAGLKQLRLAETEKYAHVTFFFNGGYELPFLGEDRILIPSPKVSTYDLKPEMSAFEITETLIEALEKRSYDVYIVNFANADMVGHTGNLEAAIQAVEVLDECFGKILKVIQDTKSILLVTADHGNIECMVDSNTHMPDTAHTCFQVPCVLVNVPDQSVIGLRDGSLEDVAPTLLDLIGLPIPSEMTGRSLLIKKEH